MAAADEPVVVVANTAAASVLLYSATMSADELQAEFPNADSAWASRRMPPPGSDARGRARLRSGVRFNSRRSEREPVDAHIRDALSRVAPIAAKLDRFLGVDENADHWGALSVHLKTDGWTDGVSVSPDQLQQLERLRLRLDITVSFIDEDHERQGGAAPQ